MKVAINGLGRIGRAALKILLDDPAFELVAANDLMPPEDVAYLIQYDTVYGRYHRGIQVDGGALMVDGTQRIRLFAERDPLKLPWRDLGVELVFECSGAFRHRADLEKHIKAGSEFVILSAAPRDDDVGIVVHGVNGADKKTRIISCASCTTNCVTPVVEVMQRRIGIERAIMTTVHAYTASQRLVDGGDKAFRRGRAAAANLVPTSTGAATATTRVLPDVAGKFDGLAIRAPLAVGSIADVVFVTSRPTTRDEVNAIFTDEARTERYRDVLGVTSDPIVSGDIIRDSHASLVDLEMTRVVDGVLVKVLSWYDNEWGFTNQMIREARSVAASKARVPVGSRSGA